MPLVCERDRENFNKTSVGLNGCVWVCMFTFRWVRVNVAFVSIVVVHWENGETSFVSQSYLLSLSHIHSYHARMTEITLYGWLP